MSLIANIVGRLESGSGSAIGSQPASMVDPYYGQYKGFVSQYGSGPAGIDNYAQQVLQANPQATLGDFYSGYVLGTGNPSNTPGISALSSQYPGAYNNLINNAGYAASTPLAQLVGGNGSSVTMADPFAGQPSWTITDPSTGLPAGSDPSQCSVFGQFFGTCAPLYTGPTGLPGAKGAGAAAGAATGSVLPALGIDIADLFTRAGLVLLALILIAAAAWALSRGELGQQLAKAA